MPHSFQQKKGQQMLLVPGARKGESVLWNHHKQSFHGIRPDGNSRPQNTGMNATFSLVVTSFIQKDTVVKAEVGEDVTREALSVCKSSHSPLITRTRSNKKVHIGYR